MKTEEAKKTRLIEVTMKFWKVFHVEVPDGVTESDVLECDLVDSESRSDWDVDREHDETSTEEHFKTADELLNLKRHEKVFTWKEAQGE